MECSIFNAESTTLLCVLTTQGILRMWLKIRSKEEVSSVMIFKQQSKLPAMK